MTTKKINFSNRERYLLAETLSLIGEAKPGRQVLTVTEPDARHRKRLRQTLGIDVLETKYPSLIGLALQEAGLNDEYTDDPPPPADTRDQEAVKAWRRQVREHRQAVEDLARMCGDKTAEYELSEDQLRWLRDQLKAVGATISFGDSYIDVLDRISDALAA